MQELANIISVILAGGLGTRLRSVVSDRPKVLAEINGRPYLAYLLDQVTEVGIRDVILCTGYLGEQVQAVFGDSYGELHLRYSQEEEPLGTAGALRLALPLVQSDTVLVMNGDSFCQADLRSFYTWHQQQKTTGSLLLTHVPDTSRYGQVRLNVQGRIESFIEKGEVSGPGWISAGIYLLKRELLQTIPAGRAVSIEKEMFPTWINQGLYGYESQGRFLDIGTPESYAIAETFFTDFR
jgi:NDP-sugar pyrophosphorylase family protein